MHQKINLYHAFEKPVTDADMISWRRYWILNGIFSAVMMILLIAGIVNNYQLKMRIEMTNNKITSFKEQFQKMKGTFPQFLFGDNINQAVENMKKEMETQRSIVRILSMHADFSKCLEALSHTIVPNVWLTRINITQYGNDVKLEGETMGTMNLHEFINKLKDNKIYGAYNAVLNDVSNKDVQKPDTPLSFKINLVRRDDK